MTQPNGGYRQDQELRARIQAFSPDEPGAVFPFSARLARENGWTRGFAQRVMEEYRRFLYLAMTAGHPVSPSVAVDQAWHQHLTYTRSYWDDLCGTVLGRPLHHEPTKGGGAEGQKFNDGYARTLDSYRAAFGQEPPIDIWPAPAERFAPAARIRQVSEATHWVVRKPRLPGGIGTTAAGLVAVLAAGACAGTGAGTLAVGGIILAAALVVAFVVISDREVTQPARNPFRPDGTRAKRSVRRNAAAASSGGSAYTSYDSGPVIIDGGGEDRGSDCDPADGSWGDDGTSDCGDSGGGDSGCSSGCGGCGGS